ncbi:pumilio homolog 5 [Phtheirospermum japonicum]|uniref:Pumilio homolog 5 n=1 Tax=Phtheirospermum japonicum TaxID=374723 RepID=A0A830BAY2_9LAMI|nr:pumilio homolog 5 [Phtheirospermum japonicum]
MATENPMRMVDSRGGSGKWAPPPRGTPAFATSSSRVVTDELGLLLRGHKYIVDREQISSIAPNPQSWWWICVRSKRLSLTRMKRSPGEDDRAKISSTEDFPRTPSPVFSQNRSSSHVEEPFHHDMQSLSLDDVSLEPTDANDHPSDDPRKDNNLTSNDAYYDDQEKQFDEENEIQHLQNTYSQHAAAAGYHFPISQLQPNNNNNNSNPILPHGVPPPVYPTTAAAYISPPGNSIYANFSSSGLYPPQYGGGYTMGSSFIPSYLAGYQPPQTGFPMTFNSNSGQKGPVVQTLNMNRFYGQQGLTAMNPSFPDPVALQYFHQTVQNPYGVPFQYGHLPSSPGAISNQLDYFSLRNDASTHAYPSRSREIGVPSNSYLSSPTGLGFVPQFPVSPVSSPRNVGFSRSSPRNVGSFGNEQRKPSFLEELKASSGRRIDLSDILGRIVEFSIDQHGSRFVQQKLESCTVEEKETVFKEIIPHCSKLITDVFGNYVIQKFFEHGTYEQRRELGNHLSGQMLPLSLQMYGCRVIQKALEVVEVEQRTELVLELDGHVMQCVRDQNGNHVIQKCIECVPTDKIDFIISAFKGQVATLSTHPYGCRVIQRILEHCSNDSRCRSIVDEILESAYDLAHNQYGNYVTQHVLERGEPNERTQIISKLSGNIVRMSQHKYASNVVEKCLGFGDAAEREILIEEILVQSENNDNLLVMMKDQFANYVVQKILEISNGKQRETLLERIKLHLIALKKYTHLILRGE